MKRFFCLALFAVTAGAMATPNIAIVMGSFYTSNLKNDLTAAGATVTEITTYTGPDLAGYNAVVMYGNTYTDFAALETYVNGGGTLIETPWLWNNQSPTAPLDIFSHGGGTSFSESYPGVTVLNASDPLLNGVTFPGGTGGFNIGRTTGNTFTTGVNQVANWGDGTAMVGWKNTGAGRVVGINMHVITSDCAYQVIDQPWATQLFMNAAAPVPEPTTVTALALGCLAVLRRRKRS